MSDYEQKIKCFEIKSGISWSKVYWHCFKFIKLDLLLLYAGGCPF